MTPQEINTRRLVILADRLQHQVRNNFDPKVNSCYSLHNCNYELEPELVPFARAKCSKALAAIEKQVDNVLIACSFGAGAHGIDADMNNAFYILYRRAGKRKAELIARSTLGAGSADVFQWLQHQFPDALVKFA